MRLFLKRKNEGCSYPPGGNLYAGGGVFGPLFNQCISSGAQAAEMSSIENIPRCANRCLGKYLQPLRLLVISGAHLRGGVVAGGYLFGRGSCVFYPIAGKSIICCLHPHVTLALEFRCILQTSHPRLVFAA